MKRKTQYRLLLIAKCLVLILALTFLLNKLLKFNQWEAFFATLYPLRSDRAILLLVILLLMPINWMLEARKWQILMKREMSICFSKAIQSVLAGLATGFISPNRIAEFAGRILFLPTEKRASGTVFSFVNSIMQNIIMSFFGIIAAFFYLSTHSIAIQSVRYLRFTGVILMFLLLLVFALPTLSKGLQTSQISHKVKQAIQSLGNLTSGEIFRILGITTWRYIVFNLQFLLMLRFFGVNLPWGEAAIAVSFMYLLVTFTPSFSAAEPAVRSSIAVLVFSVLTNNSLAVLFTGLLLWIINFTLPMLAGLFLIFTQKQKKRETT